MVGAGLGRTLVVGPRAICKELEQLEARRRGCARQLRARQKGTVTQRKEHRACPVPQAWAGLGEARASMTSLMDGMSSSSPNTKTPWCSRAWVMSDAHAAPLADLASRQNCCSAEVSSAFAMCRARLPLKSEISAVLMTLIDRQSRTLATRGRSSDVVSQAGAN